MEVLETLPQSARYLDFVLLRIFFRIDTSTSLDELPHVRVVGREDQAHRISMQYLLFEADDVWMLASLQELHFGGCPTELLHMVRDKFNSLRSASFAAVGLVDLAEATFGHNGKNCIWYSNSLWAWCPCADARNCRGGN